MKQLSILKCIFFVQFIMMSKIFYIRLSMVHSVLRLIGYIVAWLRKELCLLFVVCCCFITKLSIVRAGNWLHYHLAEKRQWGRSPENEELSLDPLEDKKTKRQKTRRQEDKKRQLKGNKRSVKKTRRRKDKQIGR